MKGDSIDRGTRFSASTRMAATRSLNRRIMKNYTVKVDEKRHLEDYLRTQRAQNCTMIILAYTVKCGADLQAGKDPLMTGDFSNIQDLTVRKETAKARMYEVSCEESDPWCRGKAGVRVLHFSSR